jgi:hypothetical protein
MAAETGSKTVSKRILSPKCDVIMGTQDGGQNRNTALSAWNFSRAANQTRIANENNKVHSSRAAVLTAWRLLRDPEPD